MKALVTGGSGFLGQHLIAKLIQGGADVRSFSRGGAPELVTLGAHHTRGDIGDPKAVADAAKGCNIVFHTAAKAGLWGKYESFYETNVTGTVNVIAACHRHDIGRLVFTSSPSVVASRDDLEAVDETVAYPEHYLAHYPHTKSMAERMVMSANDDALMTVSLRPHLIWGPGDNHLLPRLVNRARRGRLRIVGDGTNLVDSVYIDNAVDAHLKAAELLEPNSPVLGKTYFITNDEPLEVADLINRLLGTAGVEPIERKIPYRRAYQIGEKLERLYRFLRLRREPPMTRFLAHQLATAHHFDISAAKRDLGYRPAVSISEGLERLGRWIRARR